MRINESYLIINFKINKINNYKKLKKYILRYKLD